LLGGEAGEEPAQQGADDGGNACDGQIASGVALLARRHLLADELIHDGQQAAILLEPVAYLAQPRDEKREFVEAGALQDALRSSHRRGLPWSRLGL
jgi:hypothetical protein